MATNIDYLNVLNSLENITDVGLIFSTASDNYQQKRKDLENRYDEFRLSCEWIEKYRYYPNEKEFIKYVQTQTYSSYYLKHLVEKWSGKYISNGAFIAAVRFLKIPYRSIYGTPDISITIFLREEATLF